MQPFGTLAPLFMEAGLMPTPNEGQFDPNDPFARAAHRQRSAVMPPLGRDEGNLGPAMMASILPGAALAKAISMAPKMLAPFGRLAPTSSSADDALKAIEDALKHAPPGAASAPVKNMRTDEVLSLINQALGKGPLPTTKSGMETILNAGAPFGLRPRP